MLVGVRSSDCGGSRRAALASQPSEARRDLPGVMPAVHIMESDPLGQVQVSRNRVSNEHAELPVLRPRIHDDRETLDAHPELGGSQLRVGLLARSDRLGSPDASRDAPDTEEQMPNNGLMGTGPTFHGGSICLVLEGAGNDIDPHGEVVEDLTDAPLARRCLMPVRPVEPIEGFQDHWF